MITNDDGPYGDGDPLGFSAERNTQEQRRVPVPGSRRLVSGRCSDAVIYDVEVGRTNKVAYFSVSKRENRPGRVPAAGTVYFKRTRNGLVPYSRDVKRLMGSPIREYLHHDNPFVLTAVEHPESALPERIPDGEDGTETYQDALDECTLLCYLLYWSEIRRLDREIQRALSPELLIRTIAERDRPDPPQEVEDVISLVAAMKACSHPETADADVLVRCAVILGMDPDYQADLVLVCVALRRHWERLTGDRT
jgi:hypothetical protein